MECLLKTMNIKSKSNLLPCYLCICGAFKFFSYLLLLLLYLAKIQVIQKHKNFVMIIILNWSKALFKIKTTYFENKKSILFHKNIENKLFKLIKLNSN